MPNHDQLFVLTGGPGAGKTTLIKALSKRGFATSKEAGRRVIQDELARGGSALPWEDRNAFVEMMLDYEIENYKALCDRPGPVFFDRGFPDILGYVALENLDVSEAAQRRAAAYRYNKTVFILPPWREIFETDSERKQSFATAMATYDAMVKIYQECGYDLVPVPIGSVGDRTAFILQTVCDQ